MSCIFLIGMPGAGKTFWGKKLLEERQLPFADLDEYIEQEEGKSISEIFATYGEAGFRNKEAAALKKLIEEANATIIIACGGGTPAYGDNLASMKQAGCVVYLQTGIATLAERLKGDTNTRPLLTGSYLLITLEQMLNARGNIYEQADYILQEENISLANFEQIISSCIKQH